MKLNNDIYVYIELICSSVIITIIMQFHLCESLEEKSINIYTVYYSIYY